MAEREPAKPQPEEIMSPSHNSNVDAQFLLPDGGVTAPAVIRTLNFITITSCHLETITARSDFHAKVFIKLPFLLSSITFYLLSELLNDYTEFRGG